MPGMIVGSEVLLLAGSALNMSGMITLVGGNGFNDGLGADEGEIPGMTVGSVLVFPPAVGKIMLMCGEVVAGPTPTLGTSAPVIGGNEVLGGVPTGATLTAGISIARSQTIQQWLELWN